MLLILWLQSCITFEGSSWSVATAISPLNAVIFSEWFNEKQNRKFIQEYVCIADSLWCIAETSTTL